jgi:hypothetical protein
MRLPSQVLGNLPVPSEKKGAVNSLDPRAKRFRAADRSLQQARNSLLGVPLALEDIPRLKQSSLSDALDAVKDALHSLDHAAALLDQARIEAASDSD